jgi:hypothetical protein
MRKKLQYIEFKNDPMLFTEKIYSSVFYII